jgi:hypothetical protein
MVRDVVGAVPLAAGLALGFWYIGNIHLVVALILASFSASTICLAQLVKREASAR